MHNLSQIAALTSRRAFEMHPAFVAYSARTGVPLPENLTEVGRHLPHAYATQVLSQNLRTEGKHIGICFTDPDAYNNSAPVIKALLSDRRCGAITVIGDGVGLQSFLGSPLADEFKRSLSAESLYHAIANVCEPRPIDCLLSTQSSARAIEGIAFFNKELLGYQKHVHMNTSVLNSNLGPFFNDARLSSLITVDSIICSDPHTANLISTRYPWLKTSGIAIEPLGSPIHDTLSILPGESEAALAILRKQAPKITGNELVLCYLGDISNREGHPVQSSSKSFNHVEKTYQHFVEQVRLFCIENPEREIVVLFRSHPRDSLGRSEMMDITQNFNTSSDKPANLQLLNACHDIVPDIRLIRAVSDGLVGITATESKHAHLIGSKGIYLAYPGLGKEVLEGNYPGRTLGEMQAVCKLEIVTNQDELMEVLKNLEPAASLRGEPHSQIRCIPAVLDLLLA